nr:ribonuclease H-like domain-containing protein [Tanacetum cinerariifolium]
PTAPIIKDWVSDSIDESETKAPQIVLSFVQSSKKVKTPRHSVQPVETSIPAATPKPVSSADVPKIMVTRPRLAHPIFTKSKSPIRRYITRRQSPKTSNSPPRVTVVQALVVSAAQGMQGKWGNPQYALKYNEVIDSGSLRYITRNMSYLFDFEELNGGYVALEELKFNLFSISQMCDKKNHVLFIDTKCLVLSHDFKLPDESQVLLRVPRENNMYNVNLKNIVPSGDLTCLFAKATIDETSLILKTFITGLENQLSLMVKVIRSDNGTEFKNSDLNQFCSGPTWLFDINSLTKTMNYQPVNAGNQTNPSAGFQDKFVAEKAREEINQQYVLFHVSSFGSTNPQNYDGDAAFDGKEHDFDAKKPESEVIFSPSISAQSRKQDDKTKKEAKGKSHVESFT